MSGCVWSRKGAAQPNTEEKMSEVVPIRKFDDTVIGVGGIGSATVYHPARRGWRAVYRGQDYTPRMLSTS